MRISCSYLYIALLGNVIRFFRSETKNGLNDHLIKQSIPNKFAIQSSKSKTIRIFSFTRSESSVDNSPIFLINLLLSIALN
jgi:hypothetical protein